MAEQSINIPQLIAVALVGFFAIRWFLKPASPSGSGSSSPSSRNRIDVTKVDQVSSMFPQLDRRTIAWDLQRNGSNVSVTTERVLSGRSLDIPPPSFQPQLPTLAQAAGSTGGTSRSRASQGSQPDLIIKYGLQGRIAGKGKEAGVTEEQQRQAWSSDKVKRAERLKQRREEMILAARRKIEAKAAEES